MGPLELPSLTVNSSSYLITFCFNPSFSCIEPYHIITKLFGGKCIDAYFRSS